MLKLQFKENPERSIWLVGEKVSLGNHPNNTLVLDGLGIADFHAEILIEANQIKLVSEPGSCVVNNLPVDGQHTLLAGDELRIGRERLLIIDPKVEAAKAAQQLDGSLPLTAAAWSLQADHPKLKERDFSIAGPVKLGRSEQCGFSIAYKMLSREHAELWLEHDQLYIKDLGSSNGTYVNGSKVAQVQLQDGDELRFAKLSFRVQGPDALATDLKEQVAEPEAPENMDKTMIRPAINLESLSLDSKPSEGEGLGAAVAQTAEVEPSFDATHQPVAGRGRMLGFGLAALLVVAATVGWWFMNNPAG